MKMPMMGAGEPAPEAPAPGRPQEAVPTAKEEIDPLEDLLPKPALDFSRTPKHVDPNDPFNIYRPERKGVGKQELVVGAVVLAVVLVSGVGAWDKNFLALLHRAPQGNVVVNTTRTANPVAPGRRNNGACARS